MVSNNMNGEADALVHQLGERFLEEGKALEPGWSTFYGRFQYLEGAKKRTYWIRSAAGKRGSCFRRWITRSPTSSTGLEVRWQRTTDLGLSAWLVWARTAISISISSMRTTIAGTRVAVRLSVHDGGESVLNVIARKIRGVLGLGLIAGGLGLVGGALWGALSAVLTVGVFQDPGYWRFLLDRAFQGALYWGQPAAFVGLGLGTTLGLVGRRLTLRSLRWEAAALVGAFAGALFVPAYLITVAGLPSLLALPRSLLPVVGLLSLTGAALSAGLTLMAKSAEARELRVVAEVASLAAASPVDESTASS